MKSPPPGAYWVAAGICAAGSWLILALGWQHAAAEAERWQAQYVRLIEDSAALAEHVPAIEAGRVRDACQQYEHLDLTGLESICTDAGYRWTPEDLGRGTS